MTVAAPASRRLPGFAFEARAPVYEEVLPRMDVALFAGFAASGPPHVPVPVEDTAQFAAVFGADAPLAWDADLGRTVTAQLAPAVRAFFANGGRRCWVVRLAGKTGTDTLPVPGVAVVDTRGAIGPLELCARSPGSWADGVSLAASLTSRRLGVLAWRSAADPLDLVAPVEAALAPGDLLRLAWRDAGVELYLGVASVTASMVERAGAGPRRSRLRVTPGEAIWLDTRLLPPGTEGRARLATGSVRAWLAGDPSSPPGDEDVLTLVLDAEAGDAPRPGEIITAGFGSDRLMLTADRVAVVTDYGSPPARAVKVTGRGRWCRADGPGPGGPPIVERLGLELWSRVPGGDMRRLGDLGLAPGHVRHVELLPADEAVYRAPDGPDADAWRDAVTPRFPAAGSGMPRLCLPFGVEALPEHWLPAVPPDGDPLERDGLVPFDAALFSDPALAGSLPTTLLADAEYVRYLAPVPRTMLTGLHAALPVEEATLIATPDAAQPGWEPAERGSPLLPELPAIAETDPCPTDDFDDCGPATGPSPELEVVTRDADSSVLLEWTAAPDAGPFALEEATARDWRDATAVYEGWEPAATLAARRPGDYYYRVRGIGAHPTAWSVGVAARIAPGSGWRLRSPGEYRDTVLVAAHRLLLRICAARRDAMAVLSLPAHYREDDAAAHPRLLAAPAARAIPAGAALIPPLGFGERDTLAFGALYHGWLHVREDGAVASLAPDGAACGVIARRANARGAWIAPANEVLQGVVALERPAASSRWQELQDRQVNVVRRDPRGFLVLSADTLAPDDDVRPINVRRLLILLRRVALRLGATYVFEPNDDTFRRSVQRGFEAMLGDLFRRGAFAGSTAASAFQVVTGESLNTAPSVEQGRFIVELRVAPARPMAFLTLRLVQTGERVTVTGA